MSGSGTEADPYLITSAAEFYGFAKIIQASSGYSWHTNYAGKYVSLTTNIDLNNKPWYPISWISASNTANWRDNTYTHEHSFKGTFLGNGHTITNVVAPVIYSPFHSYTGFSLFGYLAVKERMSTAITIKDLNIDIVLNSSYIPQLYGGLFSYVYGSYLSNTNPLKIENVNVNYIINGSCSLYFCPESTSDCISVPVFGGLIGYSSTTNPSCILISNCNVTYSGKIVFSNPDNYQVLIGGLAGVFRGTITNCTVSAFDVQFLNYDQGSDNIFLGGLVGDSMSGAILERNYVNASFTLEEGNTKSVEDSCYMGGLIGRGPGVSGRIKENYVEVSLHAKYLQNVRMGGLVAIYEQPSTVCNNNLVQGTIDYYSSGLASNNDYNNVGGLVGDDNGWLRNNGHTGEYWISGITDEYGGEAGFYNNISNVSLQDLGGSLDNRVGGVIYGYYGSAQGNNIYNTSKYSVRASTSVNYTYGATTDDNMKLASTYADWSDFDTYWIINPKINDGYPMLRAFVDIALVTGFDGSGTEADPYLIKTYQDLLGMASYYNTNDKLETDVYWQLANDINVSVDANGLPIHFTPICYNKEFDGYFDGNGKTISGLLIDNQYEYTGLFGTIGANHWVKNLTVKGNIYWDQAYAVGGVAGRVMDGGYLQNCKFDGNIIGVLNTKQSTETNGVIGKYGINGAIDCTATYTDLKYAKIGGTTDAPTYTYYLYDWAQITTNLYDRQVS